MIRQKQVRTLNKTNSTKNNKTVIESSSKSNIIKELEEKRIYNENNDKK